jgi:D-aspartate ligase
VVGGDTKALRVDSREQLDDFWPHLRELSTQAVAQQLIPGPESAIVSYHVYVDKAGQIASEFTGRKIRTIPAEYGFTSSLFITDDDQVAGLGREICRKLDLRGVAKIDFKYAPDGRLYLLEINARCNLWLHAGARAGVNLAATMYADLTGRSRPDTSSTRTGLSWVHPKDVLAARRDGMSTRDWMTWVWRTRSVKALWRWDDPLPLLGMMAIWAKGAASGGSSGPPE